MGAALTLRVMLFAILLAFLIVAPLQAEEQDDRFVAPRRPLLDQLNRETRELYEQVRQGVVRVQLPSPRWMNDVNVVSRERLLNKYQNLDPKVRRQIEERDASTIKAKSRGPVGEPLAERTDGGSDAATTPSTGPVVTDAPITHGKGTYIVVPPPQVQQQQDTAPRDPIAGGKMELEAKAEGGPATFTPNNVGLILPGGFIMVPLYVEREACEEVPLRVAAHDGQVVDATFVGSDRQTNLTILKTEQTLGEPVRVAKEKPEEGSLVMMIAPQDGSGRLGLWTGGAQDFSIVFTSSGELAGVARYGQFLTGPACRLIADQIMRHGSVKRATLGVIISEIREDDPLRQQVPVLGRRTAMRIDQVMPDSAADRAGLKPGDLLLALAGDDVTDIPSFAAAIAARAGETELQVLRGEEIISVKVDLQPK